MIPIDIENSIILHTEKGREKGRRGERCRAGKR